jgi:hypothetical protein
MKSSISASTLVFGAAAVLAQSTGQLGDATITTNNPLGVSYYADLPESSTTSIRGRVSASTPEDGVGVMWKISLNGFPNPSIGPYSMPSPTISFQFRLRSLLTLFST